MVKLVATVPQCFSAKFPKDVYVSHYTENASPDKEYRRKAIFYTCSIKLRRNSLRRMHWVAAAYALKS